MRNRSSKRHHRHDCPSSLNPLVSAAAGRSWIVGAGIVPAQSQSETTAAAAVPVTHGEVAAHVGRVPTASARSWTRSRTCARSETSPTSGVLVVNKSTREPTKCADRPDYWRAERQLG